MEKPESFELTKSTVEKYMLRGNGTWADIVLDDQGDKRGQIMINSDYGAWSYFWGSMGCSLKEFITKCDTPYLMGKLGERNYFDEEATKECYRRNLQELLKDNDIEQEIYDKLIEEIDSADWCSADNMYHDMSQDLLGVCDPHPCMEHQPSLVNFMDRLFPVFIKLLNDETKSNIPVQPVE